MSPGFNEYGYYYNNMNCVWTVDMPDNDFIAIVPSVFNLEHATNCRYDDLRVRGDNGVTRAGPFCGNWEQDSAVDRKRRQAAKDPNERSAIRTGLPFSEAVRVYNGDRIEFKTDSSATYDGFSFDVVTDPSVLIDDDSSDDQDQQEGCSRLINGSGVVTSPNHPLDYNNSETCEFVLQAEPGMHVKLTWTHFDVEGSDTCAYDWIEVEGTKYCGREWTHSNAPEQEMIIAGERATLNWITDGSVQGTGFRLEFESVSATATTTSTTTSTTTTTEYVEDDADQEPAAFWANFVDFYTQTKAQMEAGSRPWKTPHFTWLYNRIMNENIEAQSQLEGECVWAIETGNQHPTYESVTVESFNPDVDRCINLMTMAEMGLDYIDSYICMTGHRQPRGTLRRYDEKYLSLFFD